MKIQIAFLSAAASLPVLHEHLRIAQTLERKPGG